MSFTYMYTCLRTYIIIHLTKMLLCTSFKGCRPRVSQRAYNRWMVAYTLIRNESLIVRTVSQWISMHCIDIQIYGVVFKFLCFYWMILKIANTPSHSAAVVIICCQTYPCDDVLIFHPTATNWKHTEGNEGTCEKLFSWDKISRHWTAMNYTYISH